jgi:hypothetical protein
MYESMLKGVYGHLAAGTALTTALGGTAIYSVKAPESASVPYVLISLAAGGDDNTSPRNTADVRFTVKAVAGSLLTALQLAGHVRDRLHEADPTLDGGWAAYRCQAAGGAFLFDEQVERTQFWHCGDTYRIRAVEE